MTIENLNSWQWQWHWTAMFTNVCCWDYLNPHTAVWRDTSSWSLGLSIISPKKCGRSSNPVWEKCHRGRAGGRAGAGAAVQKDPFIPIRRVRCRPQRNPMEPDTIHTILSSPNPRDIHLQIHQELGRSIYTCKLLSWVLKFLLISSQLNLGSSSCNTQVPQKWDFQENRKSCYHRWRWGGDGCKCWSGFAKYLSFVASILLRCSEFDIGSARNATYRHQLEGKQAQISGWIFIIWAT